MSQPTFAPQYINPFSQGLDPCKEAQQTSQQNRQTLKTLSPKVQHNETTLQTMSQNIQDLNDLRNAIKHGFGSIEEFRSVITSKEFLDGSQKMAVIDELVAHLLASVEALAQTTSETLAAIMTGELVVPHLRVENLDLYGEDSNFLRIVSGTPTHTADRAGFLAIDKNTGNVYAATSNTEPQWHQQ